METPLDCLLVDKHCDKYIAVLAFAIVRVNTMVYNVDLCKRGFTKA